MKTYPVLLSILIPLIFAACGSSGKSTDDADERELIAQLDEAIKNRPRIIAEKEAGLDSLKSIYRNAVDPKAKFEALGELLNAYRPFNSDSALMYVTMRQQIAPQTGNPNDVLNANLNVAEQLGFTGSYLEALQIIEPLDSTDVPDYLRPYLFHLKRTIYGRLADAAQRDVDRDRYNELTDNYRDSILSVWDSNSLVYHMVLCDKMNNHGQAKEAAAQFEKFLKDNNYSEHDKAIAAYTLSASYRTTGDRKNEKRQLLISSINDMRSAVKEYISLRELALMMYQDGDVDHAYKYLRICMDDAQDCNARQRIIEINSIFPFVNDVYLDTIDHQKNRLKLIICLVCLLSAGLVVSLFFLRKQMRRVSEAHRNEEAMNAKLKELNKELKDSNEQLLAANRAIAENSLLKEEYIARYMNQCLVYIDNLDTYRKSLNKLVLAGKLDELKKQTKSVDFIDGELKRFYDDFDMTFLKLFPSFVVQFNRLLRPDEQIIPKSDGKLNTELRIFALIRLGINDSVKIAKFLRYSVTTIYNYRARVRNRAVGDRDSLEDELMKIGYNG